MNPVMDGEASKAIHEKKLIGEGDPTKAGKMNAGVT